MRSHQPVATDDKHRVLRFRPRNSETLRDEVPTPVEAETPDDFRHRMWTNAAALAFTALLVGFGIWLAIGIADLRKSQDCVLMGRRDCAQVSQRQVSQRIVPPATEAPATGRH